MCVLAFAWQADGMWPLVLIGNRDERHDRASADLGRWPDATQVIGGLDLVSGGSWLGVSETGRLAVVTNLRGYGPPAPEAPSRGWLVRDALTGEGPYAQPRDTDLTAFNPMNLIAVAGGEATYFTNRPGARHETLGPGLYGMSNGGLQDGWPKTRRLTAFLADWLAGPDDDVEPLLAALRDENRPGDHDLPSTGLALEAERGVSPIFIRRPLYGTRCSSVVRVDADGRGEFVERRFDESGAVSGESRIPFRWP